MRQFAKILLILAIISVQAGSSWAIMVLSVNLDQMVQLADRIFLGQVQSVEDAYDEEGRWCQYVTFSSTEVYKGSVAETLKIKQVNPKQLEMSDGSLVQGTLFQGVPQFKVGEEVLVFLHGDSAIGYTSPVGLSQGLFRVTSDAQGQKILMNDAGNRGLFKKMAVPKALKAQGFDEGQMQALSASPSALTLEQMRSFIKTLVQSRGETR